MATDYYGRTWHAADTFLHEGRNPNTHRNFKKTRRVHRLPNDDIAVRLHNTDIVTYHKGTDDWQTIYMGGWDTVTTKGDLRACSATEVSSANHLTQEVRGLALERTRKVWPAAPDYLDLVVYEPNAPTSPPKIWKCRQCSGEGQTKTACQGVRIKRCHEGRTVRWYVHSETNELKAEYELSFSDRGYNSPWDQLDHDDNEPTMNDRCEHGHNRYHQTRLPGCEHGYIEPHFNWRSCYRCGGEGRTDYGSKPVPVLVSSTVPFLIDGKGRVLAQGGKAIHAALTMSVTLDAKRRIHHTLRSIDRRRQSGA